MLNNVGKREQPCLTPLLMSACRECSVFIFIVNLFAVYMSTVPVIN
jgi:hypothetical protein